MGHRHQERVVRHHEAQFVALVRLEMTRTQNRAVSDGAQYGPSVQVRRPARS